MPKTIYLAGPITSLSYDACTSWRQDFCTQLRRIAGDKIVGLSPMRGKEYLQSLAAIGHGNERYGILSSGKSIVTRDHNDVMTCDAVVMNLLGAKTVSIGSMFEVAWAHAYRKPLILVIEKDRQNIHAHDMLYEMSGYRVDNLEDALIVIASLFVV